MLSDFNRAGDIWQPSLDIKETDKQYIIHVDVPGVKKEDVHIRLRDNYLEIEGEMKKEEEKKDETYHRIERKYGNFMRRIAIPEGINTQSIQAKYDNGVLTVSVEKPEKKKEDESVQDINIQ